MTRKKGARQNPYSVSSNRKVQKSKDWIPPSNNTLTNASTESKKCWKKSSKGWIEGNKIFTKQSLKKHERTEADPGILGRTIQGNEIKLFP